MAQEQLSLIIPLPDDDTEDVIQSGKCELFENPKSAKPIDEMENKGAQSKNLIQKDNDDKSNSQPEAPCDEREYFQAPSIFEILKAKENADPNEPQKVPTNYMEDVIQRKERRWKSMNEVRGSPKLDLILDMIRKDNEMLEDEERLQREQEAQPIVSSSAARETDDDTLESMYHDALIETYPYPYDPYGGAGDLVDYAQNITLELPEITIEPQSSKEIISLHPPDSVDTSNPTPVPELEHALQGFEEINLDEKDDVIQLADPSNDTSNLCEFEDVLFKSDEKVSLSACDEIQQTVETIRVLPSADIQATLDYSSTSQSLKTDTNIHMVEKLKIEIDEEEMALLNNLTTSNERLSLGVLLPDSAFFKLEEELCDKWLKSYKTVADVSNLTDIIGPDQTLVKKPDEASILFPENSETNSNESHTHCWKINSRETSVSLENLDGNLAQSLLKKSDKMSSLFHEEIHTRDNKSWWKPSKRENSVSLNNLDGDLDQVTRVKRQL